MLFDPHAGRLARRLALCALFPLLSVSEAHCADASPRPAPLAIHGSGIIYRSPLPDTRMHPEASAIAIRTGVPLESDVALDVRRWVVTGSRSGLHAGTLVLTADRRTLIFRPVEVFAAGEDVLVLVGPGLTTDGGGVIPPMEWSFSVRGGDDTALRRLALDAASQNLVDEGVPVADRLAPGPEAVPGSPAVNGLFPGEYYPVSVVSSDLPDTVGGIFLAPFSPAGLAADRGRLLVVDHRGEPLFFRAVPGTAFDLSRQPNGLLTYWSVHGGCYVGLDSTYTAVDTFACGNGYVADLHEMRLLPNGHALLLAYDPEPYPMDTVVAGGNAGAIVTGLIIQEIDEAKNVVFQWRSWDHYQVTDFVECTGSFTAPSLDYVHGNALEPTSDGNILLSARHLNEITKIDGETGEILWRLGLNAKNNQFTFLDDAIGFSHQHDVRELPNGHITMFDNGNCSTPYSRTVEYEIDEVNHTARLVSAYRHDPDQFAGFMGNRQLHPDGSVTIGWGGSPLDPKITELHPDGSVALELGFGAPDRWSYRAVRFPWQTTAFTAEDEIAFGDVDVGEAVIRSVHVKNGLTTPLHVNQFETTDPSFAVVSPDSLVLFPGSTGILRVRFTSLHAGSAGADLYVRSVNDTEIVARVVHLTGNGTGTVGVGDEAPITTLALGAPLPNPAHERATLRFDLPHPARVSLEVFDVRGRRVADLEEGVRPAGRHVTTWSTAGRSAGVYFVRLRADGQVKRQRLAVVR